MSIVPKMASSKTLFFACLLVAAVAVTMAQTNLIPTLLGVIRIQGTVFCTASGNANGGFLGGLLTPRFPNANVQLRCGAANATIATVTTNVFGQFSFLLDRSFFNLTTILSDCRVVVTTPLATCNAALSPTGTLTAPLQLAGSILINLSNVVNVIIGSFTVTP